MNEKLERLKVIGFTLSGRWKLSGGTLGYELDHCAASKNVLYAFVAEGEVMYVGKTTIRLHDRMQRYKTPAKNDAKGGSTNIKNNANVRALLDRGRCVEIYVLPDNGLLHYGGFHVNLAAGLEDSVVRELSPPWNGGGKESAEQSLEPTADPAPAPPK